MVTVRHVAGAAPDAPVSTSVGPVPSSGASF
jgi:hypothetical protein